jgi:hypothetical protein
MAALLNADLLSDRLLLAGQRRMAISHHLTTSVPHP